MRKSRCLQFPKDNSTACTFERELIASLPWAHKNSSKYDKNCQQSKLTHSPPRSAGCFPEISRGNEIRLLQKCIRIRHVRPISWCMIYDDLWAALCNKGNGGKKTRSMRYEGFSTNKRTPPENQEKSGNPRRFPGISTKWGYSSLTWRF